MDIKSIPYHDLRLPDWGPYSKRYHGISHVSDIERGLRFDLTVAPGLWRGEIRVPNVNFPTGVTPTLASNDLNYTRWRYRIGAGNTLTADFESFLDSATKQPNLRVTCRNYSARKNSLSLHMLASLAFPPLRDYSSEPFIPAVPVLPRGAVWISADEYEQLQYTQPDHRDKLPYDGHIKGQVRGKGFCGGKGIGTAMGKAFGKDAGDRIQFRLPESTPREESCLVVRYRMDSGTTNVLRLTCGPRTEDLVLNGTGDFELATCSALSALAPGKIISLIAGGGTPIELDGVCLVPQSLVEEVRFVEHKWTFIPEVITHPADCGVLLKYADLDFYYGIGWMGKPWKVRHILDDSIDVIIPTSINSHGNSVIKGNGKGHFLDLILEPVHMRPKLLWQEFICIRNGTREEVIKGLSEFAQKGPNEHDRSCRAAARACTPLPRSKSGHFCRTGVERLATVTLTNVVFPVLTRNHWIRHNTPGRIWDCLYTWDSGFIALGLTELSAERAIDCLNCYFTDPNDEECAFIHHGSPVPSQFFALQELFHRTSSKELLIWAYPRLKKMHKFLSGRIKESSFGGLASGLLRPWDYFYNSGGWDDYPAQKFVHQNGLSQTVTPVITTALAARTAIMLGAIARLIGEEADLKEWESHADALVGALELHSWDRSTGYYGYVVHDNRGLARGILKHPGSNTGFNNGMDGCMPLLSGNIQPERAEVLIKNLRDEKRLNTPIGLTSVDQSAPYYDPNGYWNGTVWMPHQWMMWKALLDWGEGEAACEIAMRALHLWQDEVDMTGNSSEHFSLATHRGAGWHHFSGLSCPILNWYGACFDSGRITGGFDVWFTEAPRKRAGKIEVGLLQTGRSGGTADLLFSAPSSGHWTAWFDDKKTQATAYGPQLWVVEIPKQVGYGKLRLEQIR